MSSPIKLLGMTQEKRDLLEQQLKEIVATTSSNIKGSITSDFELVS
jgi:hypothetical protein